MTVARYHGRLSRREKEAAIVSFRDHADVLVTTEAAGEGRNLQFCHAMVNFDLPWNPMKIEQRLGRIHRIGQRHDVEVTNLLCKGTIEERVMGVLESKINLFELVVGELDMILGRVDDELRPFRAHVLFTPALRLPVGVRRGSRIIPLSLTWLLGAASFADLRCPHCGVSELLVAGRQRLGCRSCLPLPASPPPAPAPPVGRPSSVTSAPPPPPSSAAAAAPPGPPAKAAEPASPASGERAACVRPAHRTGHQVRPSSGWRPRVGAPGGAVTWRPSVGAWPMSSGQRSASASAGPERARASPPIRPWPRPFASTGRAARPGRWASPSRLRSSTSRRSPSRGPGLSW